MPHYWNYWLIFFFLMIRLRLWRLGRKTIEVKSHFYHIISRVHVINMISHWAWSPSWHGVIWFLYCKWPLFSSFPYCTLWQEITVCSPYLSCGDLGSPSLRTEYLHSSVRKICLLSPTYVTNSIIYLYQYEVMDTYFILWVLIQYCFILLLKLSQDWPLGALSIGSVSLWHTLTNVGGLGSV